MKVKDVYAKFNTPPNLQQHLLTVTSIVIFIQDHWTGPTIDWPKLISSALLHDLGNIVRFDFDNHPEFLGDEVKNIDHWRNIKQTMITKYGSDDHEATRIMLREINADFRIVDWILSKSFANAEEIATSSVWENKVLLYADMRVAPTGIVSLAQRMDEVSHRHPKYINNPEFPKLANTVYQIEQEISSNINGKLSDINETAITVDQEKLLNLEI